MLSKIALSILVLIPFSFADSQKKVILFFGDSLTAGYGLSLEQAFPNIVANKLNEKEVGFEIINAGLSGETTAGGVNRIDWILKKPVDILVLELGANDGLRGLPLATTEKNLQAIINKVKAKNPDVKIIIAGMMVPPNMGKEYSNAFKNIFPKIAQKNDAVLIPFLLEGVAGDKTLNLNDGIHPNAKGHTIVANNVIKAIHKVL